MLQFMVLSAPRSASTWVANWLTTDKTLCLHDPILEYTPEMLDDLPCERALGVSCTGLPLLTSWVNDHPARKLIVHRDTDDINRSLLTLGLTPLTKAWHGALERLRGFHVAYEQLFEPYPAKHIYEYVTGLPFDADRHARLCEMHIEPQFERVNVIPDRARDFRRRVEACFA